jgi:hypothetical protein
VLVHGIKLGSAVADMCFRSHAFGRAAPETGRSRMCSFDPAHAWQALARAVYARADLVLLDDVFSALDGETEAHGGS